jgi:hypothetical protein
MEGSRGRIGLLAIALLLSGAVSLNATEPLGMDVTPRQSVAPTNLRIRVYVEPSSDNRALEVSADSIRYYRSSVVQLDGAESPRTIWFDIANAPPGDYEVTGALINSSGRKRASVRRHVTVMGSGGR